MQQDIKKKGVKMNTYHILIQYAKYGEAVETFDHILIQ